MTYYRVAFQVDQAPTWKWKSTMLTSIDAVFGFLKIYKYTTKNSVRVFLSSSPEVMDELLKRENSGLVSNCYTPDQLWHGCSKNPYELAMFEQELGEGGDHDLPYQFTAPGTMKEAICWVKLLAKVHNGELEP